MEDSDQMVERIELFLLNKLEKSAKESFLNELDSNAELRQLYDVQRMEHELLDVLVEEDLKANVSKWNAELDNQPSAPEPKKKPLLKVLAFILLAIAGALSIISYLNKENTANLKVVPVEQKLSEESYAKEEVDESQDEELNIKKTQSMPKERNVVSPVGRPAIDYTALLVEFEEPMESIENFRTTDENAGSINLAIQNKDWKEAMSQLENMDKVDKEKLRVKYQMGHLLYSDQQYSKAIPYLESISSSAYLHAEKSQWLLVLSYLGANDLAKCRLGLKNILSDIENSYYEEATLLDSKLN